MHMRPRRPHCAHTSTPLLNEFHTTLDSTSMMGTSLHASAPRAAAAARQARDDDVEEGDDGVDNGRAGGADGVHDGHEAVADGAEDTLNLFVRLV